MESIFTNIYESKIWGDNHNSNYNGSSGPGSSIVKNQYTYVLFLKKLILDNNIRTIVDLGCGDFLFGNKIYDDLDIIYIGYDIYKKLINYNSKINSLPKYTFIHLDIFYNRDKIRNGDLCILKDILQHWCNNEINIFLTYLIKNKKFRYILICNSDSQNIDNADIITGDWRSLSSDFLPLRDYNPIKLYHYDGKEVSLITVN